MTHKLFCCAVVLISAASLAQAQPVYQKNDNVIGLGLGVGGAYNIDASDYDTPLFNASFERAAWPVGWDQTQGVVSLGLFAGFKQSGRSEDLTNGFSYAVKQQFRVIGIRSAFHLQNYFGRELKKWDLYGGIMLGVYYEKSTTVYNYPPPFTRPTDVEKKRNASFSGYFGARYFFKEHWAICGETGFGYTNFLLGAGYRF
jgi:hypothetical protein